MFMVKKMTVSYNIYNRNVLTYVLLLLVILWSSYTQCLEEELEFCPIPSKDKAELDDINCDGANLKLSPRFILYDVNPPEGFNLRRDVYMRIAVLARKLQKMGDWHLVLPPWGRLYHWQSSVIGKQELIPWTIFFDMPSLQKFAPVLDMYEFLTEYKTIEIEEVYVLQHYKEDWESGNWVDKYGIEPCQKNVPYGKLPNGTYDGSFWGYTNITAKQVQCLSFHGHASQLAGFLKKTNARTVKFDHAEIALHDTFGDKLYWMARRSMRFAAHLVELAAQFRQEKLNSTDKADGTVRPADWMEEKPKTGTKGGPFLCVHLRRKDFVWGRSKDVPSLEEASKQIQKLLKKQKLNTVFIATDAPSAEFQELQILLSEFTVVRYEPTRTVHEMYKDGGVAIIEQIICLHARYFIGTYESTFSFRIQEEREILGFPSENTFNRLCGTSKEKCEPPSKWKIVF